MSIARARPLACRRSARGALHRAAGSGRALGGRGAGFVRRLFGRWSRGRRQGDRRRGGGGPCADAPVEQRSLHQQEHRHCAARDRQGQGPGTTPPIPEPAAPLPRLRGPQRRAPRARGCRLAQGAGERRAQRGSRRGKLGQAATAVVAAREVALELFALPSDELAVEIVGGLLVHLLAAHDPPSPWTAARRGAASAWGEPRASRSRSSA